jgi:hypothetical protein
MLLTGFYSLTPLTEIGRWGVPATWDAQLFRPGLSVSILGLTLRQKRVRGSLSVSSKGIHNGRILGVRNLEDRITR